MAAFACEWRIVSGEFGVLASSFTTDHSPMACGTASTKTFQNIFNPNE
jgi:hypothetical protein